MLLYWWGSLAQVNVLLFLLLMALGITAFAVKGHYARRKAFWDEAGEVLGVFTLLLALNATIAFSGKWPLSRLWLFSTWVLALALLPLARWLAHHILQRLGVWMRPVVVVGCGRNAAEAIRALDSEPMLGYAVQRVLTPGGAIRFLANFPPRRPWKLWETIRWLPWPGWANPMSCWPWTWISGTRRKNWCAPWG
uniref:Uncharacterized protein n=1 Tax=mine drainage metagenome TaxID=410659 RepID=E6QEI6_9ZZZZ